MSPASQHQVTQPSVPVAECEDDSRPVTLKICECFFEEGKEDMEVVLEEEKQSATEDSGSVKEETDEEEEEKDHVEDDEEEDAERLSLVNETGSCSGEEEEGGCGGRGGLIDQDDSIYQVQFPTSFVELDESRQSRQNSSSVKQRERDLIDSNQNEKVEAWLNTDSSLKKQRKGILRRKSQLDDDIFQLRPSRPSSDESFTRKIHPKYASLNGVKEFASPGETWETEGEREGERDLSGSSSGKRKRVTLADDDLIVPHKRGRQASPAGQGWLDYLPGWVSGFFR